MVRRWSFAMEDKQQRLQIQIICAGKHYNLEVRL
jgi:hypothetical protein